LKRTFIFGLALLLSGCAQSSQFERIEFRAPSPPDAALQPYLDGVERMGVVCVTNIEPFRELDVEKVMALLSNATMRNLSRLPETTIISQDEITWKLKTVHFDSTSVHTDTIRAALRDTLALDAIVFVELRHLQARMMPMTPTPYGMSPNPSMDMSVDLQVSLINLHTNQVWKRGGLERNLEPIRLQLTGANNQSERQLLMALGKPMQRFLARVAPPPKRQSRHFETSGN
tara:strand:- start:266 stop:955 length:690 start_codon:yes stop_codon:yes gene_type:complete